MAETVASGRIAHKKSRLPTQCVLALNKRVITVKTRQKTAKTSLKTGVIEDWLDRISMPPGNDKTENEQK